MIPAGRWASFAPATHFAATARCVSPSVPLSAPSPSTNCRTKKTLSSSVQCLPIATVFWYGTTADETGEKAAQENEVSLIGSHDRRERLQGVQRYFLRVLQRQVHRRWNLAILAPAEATHTRSFDMRSRNATRDSMHTLRANQL